MTHCKLSFIYLCPFPNPSVSSTHFLRNYTTEIWHILSVTHHKIIYCRNLTLDTVQSAEISPCFMVWRLCGNLTLFHGVEASWKCYLVSSCEDFVEILPCFMVWRLCGNLTLFHGVKTLWKSYLVSWCDDFLEISPCFMVWWLCGNLTLFHGVKTLWKGTVSAEFRVNLPKLFGNCVFPQNFHTRTLSEITVCHAVGVNKYEYTCPS